MEITCYKKIDVQLSDEEIETLENARKILYELEKGLYHNDCNYVFCDIYCEGETYSYSHTEIHSLIKTLENLSYIKEMY